MSRFIISGFCVLLLFFSIGCGKEPKIISLSDNFGEQASEAQQINLPNTIGFGDTAITYYDSASMDVQGFAMKEDSTPLTIVDYGPVKELPVENKRPTVYVVFSQPMVPLMKLGEPMTESSIMKISPSLRGTYRWYGSRLLSFEPDEPLLSQRRYKVTVSRDAQSLGKKNLEKEHQFEFYSEYLDIADFHPGKPEKEYEIDYNDVPVDDGHFITIRFNYPVNLEVVKKFIKVEINGRGYSVSLSRPEGEQDQALLERSTIVTLDNLPPENSAVTVTLLAGARSEEDFIGRPKEVVKKFQTIKPFRYKSNYTSSYSFPRSKEEDLNPVYFEFSHPVKADNIEQYISTSLAGVTNLKSNISVWYNIVKLTNLPVKYDSIYMVTLSGNLSDIYGRTLGSDIPIQVKVGRAQSYSYFPNTGTKMLEAKYPPKIIFEYQNVASGVWKAAPIDDPYPYHGVPFTGSELGPWNFSGLTPNTKHYAVLDLAPWLNASQKGFVGLEWKFNQTDEKGNTWLSEANLNLQVTDLGVTTRYAYNTIIVWVNSLSTGLAVPNATVTLMRVRTPQLSGKTDSQGMAVIPLKAHDYRRFFMVERTDELRIRVEAGDDKVEFKPNHSHNAYHFGVYRTDSPASIEDVDMQTFMLTDRGLYKPGETVSFRGIDRNLSAGAYSSFTGPYELVIRSSGWQTKPILSKTGNTTASGGFYGKFDLPANLEPGYYYLEYKRDNQTRNINFQVAQFRRLAFQIRIDKPERTYFYGDSLSFALKASYLAGGDLAGADYDYYWFKQPTSFTPEGALWKDFQFGPSGWDSSYNLSSGKGTLDALGGALVSQATTREGKEGKTYRYTVEARVRDITRQEIAARESAVVHPAAFYIGAKLPSAKEGWWSRFIPSKQAQNVELALVKPNGELDRAICNLRVQLVRVNWKVSQQRGVYGRMNSMYERVEEIKTDVRFDVSGGRANVSVTPDDSGSFIVRITGEDSRGGQARTDLEFYATGASWVRLNQSNPDDINLMVDKPLYEVGETARILVQSPLPRGKYLLTLEGAGIFEERIIELSGSMELIEIPVKSEYVPIFYMALSSYTKREADPVSYFEPDLGKPKGYFGLTPVKVSTKARSFSVEILPAKEAYAPGESAEVTLRVTRNGRPVADAEVTYLAADRGVLDLIDYHIPDPVEFFYNPQNFSLGVDGADSRSLLIDPVNYTVKDLQGGGGGGDDDKLQKRKDFTPLAVFEPFLKTDAEGKVTVRFTLPDTLTTYRSTAIVVKEDYFGIQEKEIMVQNPLNVRSVLPRRMRVRDTAVAGCFLTNLTGEDQDVSIVLETKGIAVNGPKEKNATVRAKQSLQVPFSLMAGESGEATLLFTIRSKVLSEQLEEKLVIEEPLVKEAFTVMGKTDKLDPGETPGHAFAEEGFVIPKSIAPGYGSLVIRLDSSRLTSLSDAVEYLLDYPHGCAEQRLSKTLPYILFDENLAAFGSRFAAYYKPAVVLDLFELLGKYQRPDGGIPLWLEGGYLSDPYVSVKAAHYVLLAAQHGFAISGKLNLPKLHAYINALYTDKYVPDYLKIYALYVLSLNRGDVRVQLGLMLGRGDTIGIAGYAMIALSYLELGDAGKAGELLAKIKNFIKVGTQSIDLLETYEASYYFDSSIQKLALLLMLYAKLDPDSDMLQRITTVLMRRQRGGHWQSTADTAWCLIAFRQIFGSESGENTRFNATVLLDKKPLLENMFVGISKEPQVSELFFAAEPLSRLERNKLFPLLITKDGNGMLFYSMSLRYALPSEIVLARDEGFSVFSEVYDLDGKKVEGRELELGKTYRMKAVVSTSKRRMFVALRVPVPSGAEIIDASFVTSGLYLDKKGTDARSFTRETIYGSQFAFTGEGNMYLTPQGLRFSFYTPARTIMDNEVRYYFDDFYTGKNEVEFLFRTTSPGIFPTPPAYAECMYEEEVFGRSAGKLWVIKEK